jgi:hypothetical protein
MSPALTGGHPFSAAAAETLGAHRTLTQAEVYANDIFTFDPGGSARNLILPAEADNAGVVLYINNSADNPEVITIQDDSPATVCTPTENESAIVWCDGVAWYGSVGAAS